MGGKHEGLHLQTEYYKNPPGDKPLRGGGLGRERNPFTPDELDNQTRIFTESDPQKQIEMWTTPEFAATFPHIVQRVLSSEGQKKYSKAERDILFQGSLKALSELDTRTMRSKEARARSGTNQLQFNIRKGVAEAPTHNRNEQDSLFRIDLAGVILLGISISDKANPIALEKIVNTVANSKGAVEKVQSLGLLLPTNSVARRWVKENGLDTAAGREWDETIAEILVNLPGNTIDLQYVKPRSLPTEMTTSDAHLYYSKEAYAIFVDYAADLVDIFTGEQAKLLKRKMSSRVSGELQFFIANIHNFPREFQEHPLTKNAVEMIKIATHLQPHIREGSIPNARELLPTRKRAKLQWYDRGVQHLLSRKR